MTNLESKRIMTRKRIASMIFAAVVIVAMAGIMMRNHFVAHGNSGSLPSNEAVEERDHVELTEEKYEAAEIKVASVGRRTLQPHRIVPGRIEYNATRHVEVKAPFDGLIRKVEVKVGDRVTDGQILAVVDSPELGERRADVLLRESMLNQAKIKHDWWHEIQANLDDLVARLKRPQEGSPADREKDEKSQLEKDFADKPLGEYRDRIFAAYWRMRLDERFSASIRDIGEGAAKLKKAELDSARDTSRSKFVSACEQAKFDTRQMHVQAETEMDDAACRLDIAKQRLSSLVGVTPDKIASTENHSLLSTWPVKAPFTGTIEEVLLPPNERIVMSQGLFQVADVSRLWVQADIRERDWSALKIEQGLSLSVQTPALPGKTLEATVSYIGRAVSADSRAVPLIADIDNQDGFLRPGMFVRVLIPEGDASECLVVPESAITSNDRRTFVFVETEPRKYYPRDVKIGRRVDSWVEIVTGLKPGESVVISGTPLLKAELLLEPDD